jgi:CDP-paratose 2-epimerase
MKVLITGGAGFIGCNSAARFLRRGDEVVVIDNLIRPGMSRNLEWLKAQGKVTFVKMDIVDGEGLERAIADHADCDLVLHLAGQVAVTSSVVNPRADFNANLLGTFNLLEAVRRRAPKVVLVYSSTNKVYGGMEDQGVTLRDGRYVCSNLPHGVNESVQLDFHSPYGCSKGGADQYVRDYHRIYGLRSVVFRQSCIYGYRQFGLEDQGWVAWFTIASQLKRPISLYGDGRQVRDILFVDDLVDAYEAAYARIDQVAGQVFNVGGGPSNTISLLDLLEYLGRKQGAPIPYTTMNWRPGDQRVFVSDNRRAAKELGWTPKTNWQTGLDLLYSWVGENKHLF